MTDMTPTGAPDGAQGQEMTADAGRPAGAGLSDDALRSGVGEAVGGGRARQSRPVCSPTPSAR